MLDSSCRDRTIEAHPMFDDLLETQEGEAERRFDAAP
jgi:hypothetical protein